MKKDFLSILDMTAEEILATIDFAIAEKNKGISSFIDGDFNRPLDGKTAALIFKKPSLRTRVSFEIGVRQYGGHGLYITDASIGLGSREAVEDASRVLARYVDLIVIRTFDHKEVEAIAKYADVPVINALTDLLHPCQILGDAMTIKEHLGRIENVAVSFVGDGANNIANSWLNLAARIPMDLRIGTNLERLPDQEVLENAKKVGLSKITITDDPIEAVKDTNVVYSDVFASMGDKDNKQERLNQLMKFQANDELMSHTAEGSLFMHCLPAERGVEVTDSIMDGKHSVIYDEAENRLHIQKSIINWLFTK